MFINFTAAEDPRLPAKIVKITKFQQHEGLYYQSQETVEISNLGWNLLTYIDLSIYTSRYATLITYYNVSAQICIDMKRKFENTNIP